MAYQTAKNSIFILGLIFSLVGCGSPSEDKKSNVDRDITVTIDSNALNVNFGGSITLTWSTSGADSCLASGDWSGSKALIGSQSINSLNANATFNLTCSRLGGDAIDSVNVIVVAPSAPVVNISASPPNIAQNGSTTLSWSATNVTSCIASGDWSGAKSITGSQTINALNTSAIFRLTCSGPGGSAIDSVNVIVSPLSAPVINFTASPTSIVQGGSTTVSWSATNAASCTASGDWSGAKATAGMEIISGLTSTSTFNLSCSGPGGSGNDSLVVTMTAPPAPTVTLSANPTSVTQNSPSVLSWNTNNANSCNASGDWTGIKAVSGSETIASISSDSVFTLVCSGAGGNGSDSVSVMVVTVNNGTALLSWLPPTENTDGTPLIDLTGFKIYYGTSSGNYSNTVTLNNAGLSSYLVENLAPATWYFSMTAFNSSGIESQRIAEISKQIN